MQHVNVIGAILLAVLAGRIHTATTAADNDILLKAIRDKSVERVKKILESQEHRETNGDAETPLQCAIKCHEPIKTHWERSPLKYSTQYAPAVINIIRLLLNHGFEYQRALVDLKLKTVDNIVYDECVHKAVTTQILPLIVAVGDIVKPKWHFLTKPENGELWDMHYSNGCYQRELRNVLEISSLISVFPKPEVCTIIRDYAGFFYPLYPDPVKPIASGN